MTREQWFYLCQVIEYFIVGQIFCISSMHLPFPSEGYHLMAAAWCPSQVQGVEVCFQLHLFHLH